MPKPGLGLQKTSQNHSRHWDWTNQKSEFSGIVNKSANKERKGKKRANKTILGENNISQRKEKLGRKLAYNRR